MPRSRSMSLESMTRSPIFSCAAKVPDCFSRQSTSVVLPWSTWAMMAMLRIGRCMGSADLGQGKKGVQGSRSGAGRRDFAIRFWNRVGSMLEFINYIKMLFIC